MCWVTCSRCGLAQQSEGLHGLRALSGLTEGSPARPLCSLRDWSLLTSQEVWTCEGEQTLWEGPRCCGVEFPCLPQGGAPSPFDRNFGTKISARAMNWVTQKLKGKGMVVLEAEGQGYWGVEGADLPNPGQVFCSEMSQSCVVRPLGSPLVAQPGCSAMDLGHGKPVPTSCVRGSSGGGVPPPHQTPVNKQHFVVKKVAPTDRHRPPLLSPCGWITGVCTVPPRWSWASAAGSLPRSAQLNGGSLSPRGRAKV